LLICFFRQGPTESCAQTNSFRIDKRVGGPKALADFFAADEHAGSIEENGEHLQWLAFEPQLLAVLEQFSALRVELKRARSERSAPR
jgi:hypothetical protein